MKWTTTRHDVFEYQRLTRTGALVGTVDGVSACSLTEDLNTALKASGTLDLVGAVDFGDDRIRIILHATEGNETVGVVLGTFLASTPARNINGATATASVELHSLLLILDEDRYETTLSIPAGTNAVAYARQVAIDAGLEVNAADSAAVTNVLVTFEAGTTRLEVVNHLLDYAGYSSAAIDAMGAVVMRPYVDPDVRSVAWTFHDDDESILLPEITDELDWYHTPNVVVVVASNAEATLLPAVAVDSDPLSPYSTVARGRRIVRRESVSDAPSQAALQAKADALLASSSNNIATDTIGHSYAPFSIGDAVRLAYSRAGIDRTMVVQSREMDLVPGVPTTTKMRRFVRG